MGPAMQGEVWPNRCSEAIDEANSRIADLCEGSGHLHFIDIGSVRPALFIHPALGLLGFCAVTDAISSTPFL